MAAVEETLEVQRISRKRFLDTFGAEYRPGQHVTFLGPSGRGKTRLALQMALKVRAHIKTIRIFVLHGKIKGRDQTIEEFSARSGMPVVTHFPVRGPIKKQRVKKAQGFVLCPLNKADTTDAENQLLRAEYKKTIHAGYHAPRKAPVIIIADEAHQTQSDLKLMKDCEGPLMRGRPVCSMWSLVQRGRYVSYHTYDQAEWVLIFYDPDRNNQERYSEIGDVDPWQLVELSRQLKTETVADGSTISEAVCFRRSGNQLFIVGI